LKGIDNNFKFENSNAIQFKGDPILIGNSTEENVIILSENIANKLETKIGDQIIVYFLDPEQTTPRIRKLKIVGTYHTGIEEIDNSFGLCDINLIRKVY